MFESLWTWGFIISFGGMVCTVCAFTQLLKKTVDKKIGKIKTARLVYALSVFVVGIVVGTTQDFNVPIKEIIQIVFVALVNSVLVALLSMKSYEDMWSLIPNLFSKGKEFLWKFKK